MRQYQQVAPSEYFAFFTFGPFVEFDELQYIVHIQSLLQFDFVLSLDFPNDSDEVEKGVFDLYTRRFQLFREVLIQDF